MQHVIVLPIEYLETDMRPSEIAAVDPLQKCKRVGPPQREQLPLDCAVPLFLRPKRLDLAALEYVAVAENLGMTAQGRHQMGGTRALSGNDNKAHGSSPPCDVPGHRFTSHNAAKLLNTLSSYSL